MKAAAVTWLLPTNQRPVPSASVRMVPPPTTFAEFSVAAVWAAENPVSAR